MSDLVWIRPVILINQICGTLKIRLLLTSLTSKTNDCPKFVKIINPVKKMKGSRVNNDENNYRGKKCPCPGNPEYSQRSARTPLGDIQDALVNRQYKEDYGPQKKIGIESTRISVVAPRVKEPLTKITPTVMARPMQRGELQQLLAQAPMKVTKSNSCRCPESQTSISPTVRNDSTRRALKSDGCVEIYSPYENSDDHVFLKPLSTTRIRSHSTSRDTPSPSHSVRSATPHYLSSTSSKYNYNSQAQSEMSQKTSCYSSKRDKSPATTFLKARSTEYVSGENSLRSISGRQNSLMSSSQSSSSSKRSQGCCSTKIIHKNDLRSPEPSSSLIPRFTAFSTSPSSSSRSLATLVQSPSIHEMSSSRMTHSSSRSSASLVHSPPMHQMSSSRMTHSSLRSSASLVQSPSIHQMSSSKMTHSSSRSSATLVPSPSMHQMSSSRMIHSSLRSSASLVQSPSIHQMSSSGMTHSSSRADSVRSNCSPAELKSIRKLKNSSDRYTTLPSQRFVTLSEDTLHSTASRSSGLNSMTSALSKVRTVRDSSFFPEDEQTFVDGDTFFQDLDQGKSSTIKTIPVFSPPKLDIPVRRSTSVSDSSRIPAVKTTLKRRSSINKISFPLLFSPEYIEEIISYSYKNANNLVLKPEWIEAYVDKRYRSFTVDWLLQITQIVSPHFEPVYYMAVRIFDYTIIRLRLRKGHYQLAAMVAFWISLKYLDNTILLKIPKIFSLCNGKYSKTEILRTERIILKSLKYCLNVSDPLDFLHNYLKSSNLENNELLKYGSQFVLECATLFETYPLAQTPFIAASALYLAYKIIFKTTDVYVNFMWFERKRVEKFAHSVLAVNVKYAIMEKYEPLKKYLTPEKLNVAKEFFNL